MKDRFIMIIILILLANIFHEFEKFPSFFDECQNFLAANVKFSSIVVIKIYFFLVGNFRANSILKEFQYKIDFLPVTLKLLFV